MLRSPWLRSCVVYRHPTKNVLGRGYYLYTNIWARLRPSHRCGMWLWHAHLTHGSQRFFVDTATKTKFNTNAWIRTSLATPPLVSEKVFEIHETATWPQCSTGVYALCLGDLQSERGTSCVCQCSWTSKPTVLVPTRQVGTGFNKSNKPNSSTRNSVYRGNVSKTFTILGNDTVGFLRPPEFLAYGNCRGRSCSPVKDYADRDFIVFSRVT